MLRLSDEHLHAVAAAVAAARRRPELRAAVADVYDRVQAEVDDRRPACGASGRCCHFEAYGHRLFVTTLELAAFVAQLDAPTDGGSPAAVNLTPGGPSGPGWDGSGCPFQVGGLCAAHAIRPFGCRIYFCDATSTEWQQARYEQFHGDLKALHERAGVPYYYVEWREGLRAVGIEPSPDRGPPGHPSPARVGLPQLRHRTQD